MRTIRVAIAACLLIFPVLAFAEDKASAEQVKADIRAKAAKIKTFIADVDMAMNMGGMKMNFGGSMQAKDKMLATTMSMDFGVQKMMVKAILDKDSVMWMDMDMMGQKQVMKMKMDEAKMKEMREKMMPGAGGGMENIGSDPRQTLESYGQMYDLTVEPNEKIDGDDIYVLSGTMNEKMKESMKSMAANGMDMTAMMGKIRIKYGVKDGFQRSMEMMGTDGTPWMTQIFKNVKLNTPIDDAAFAYSPPAGVQVMDMSQMAALGAGDAADDSHNSKLKVGDQAPDFEGKTLTGEPVKLSSYKGKIVVLDFWATWCGPCIHELPNVVSLYEQFHPKGLEIIGISLDDDRPALESFLKEKKEVAWTQIFDGKGFEGKIPTGYGVDAIPFTLLLDRTGKIIAKELRGDKLKAAVAEALDTAKK